MRGKKALLAIAGGLAVTLVAAGGSYAHRPADERSRRARRS